MADRLTIFNLALKQLEQTRLATADDESEDGDTLREFLPLAIRSILRETLWQNFKTTARFRQVLSEDATELVFPYDFKYAYYKPVNCITLVFPNISYRKFFEPRLHPTRDENLVFTKQAVESFDFIRFTDNLALWHAEQAECLAFKLADYLAPQYLNDSGKVTRINRMLKGKIEKASVFSGQEVGEEVVDRSGDNSDIDISRISNRGFGPRGPGYSPFRDGFE